VPQLINKRNGVYFASIFGKSVFTPPILGGKAQLLCWVYYKIIIKM